MEKEDSKVNRETAVAEVQKWLDAKKVSQNKKDSLTDVELELVDAIVDGYLELTEDNQWKHKLKFPLESGLSELTYAFRMNTGKLEMKLRNVKDSDLQGRIKVYVAVLTDQPNGIIQALDTADGSIAQSIASYFF